MYAEIDRDLKRAEEMREPFWAEYEENLSADALKRVIDFQNGRNLPSKAKLIVEIRRWLKKPTAAQKKTLTYGSKDELEALRFDLLVFQPYQPLSRFLADAGAARRRRREERRLRADGVVPAQRLLPHRPRPLPRARRHRALVHPRGRPADGAAIRGTRLLRGPGVTS